MLLCLLCILCLVLSVSESGLVAVPVVLLAYCLRGSERLKTQARGVLKHLGFRVPNSEPVARALPRHALGSVSQIPILSFEPCHGRHGVSLTLGPRVYSPARA